ncbi:MAG: hypothetical protein ACKEQI_00135 [Candidatus Hodgkinia cicadicola]
MGYAENGGWSAVEASFWRRKGNVERHETAELMVSAGGKGGTAECETAERLELNEISDGTFPGLATPYSRCGTEVVAEGI